MNTKIVNTLIMVFIIVFLNVSYMTVEAKVDLVADVLIYKGAGVLSSSVISFEKFLEWKGLTWFECDDTYIENNDLFQDFQVIYFPGGDFSRYVIELNSVGLQHIRDFIAAGGGYIGICGGGYFACDRVNWLGTAYDYPLDLFNGVGYGPIEDIAPYGNYVMTTINIEQSNPINQYEPITEDMMYYGGAAFYADENQNINVIGTYDTYHNDKGIINFNYGSGRVVLIGPHPEFEEDSTRDGVTFGDELADNGTDWNLLWTCMDWLMNVPISEPPIPHPPNIPTITGNTVGKTGQMFEYTVTTIDPDGDMISYFIDWGDGIISSWIGPFPSGTGTTESHSWSADGDYTIKAKAKDIYDNESDWASLTVTIPCSYDKPIPQFLELLFQRFPNTFPFLRQLLEYKEIEIKEIPESDVNTLDCKEKESLGSYNITWKKHIIDTTFDYAFGVFACDVDNDKDCDILGAAQNGDFIAWYRNDGGNPINWTKLIIDDHFDGATSVFAVDIDGDLDIDVVGSAWQAQEIALWMNDGGTPITWRKSVIKSGFAFAHEAYCYDLDQDGKMDILGASTDNDQIAWWRNNGGNPISWTEQIISSDFDGAKSVRVADFDNDGLLDLVGTAFYDDEIRWWRNCGGVPIVWEEHVIIDNFNGSHRVEPCDMDFDGDMDIVGAGYWEGELAWWRNDGGTPLRWTKRVIATHFNGACTGLPVDIDKDGDIDVIGTAQQAYDVALFRNDGGNLFTWTKVIIDANFFGAWPCYLYDIDGDGDVDIVAGASFGDKLAWWESDLNQQPFKPERPSGTASGKPGTEYVFSSRTTDPFGLDLYYLWDWGDGTISEWMGPYRSGETCNASHVWSDKGYYQIKVKAKNINNNESDWSDPFPTTMPYFYNPFQQFLDWLFQRFPHAFPVFRHSLR